MKATILNISFVLIATLSLKSYAQLAVAGKTMVTRGSVNAYQTENSDEMTRKLKRRSPIYTEDIVTTGAQSKAQLRMTDGGMIALKENSELIISEYQFAEQDKQGSVVMELVTGGLRSVTGAIKSESGNYQLKTPVGSIGIRGTHYEIEIISGQLFVAVWDGAVDISININSEVNTEISLGEGEDYAYAQIDETGEVTPLLEPPENFASGMSTEPKELTQEASSEIGNDDDKPSETENTDTEGGKQSTTLSMETFTASVEVKDPELLAEEAAEALEIEVLAEAPKHEEDIVIEDESFLATDDFNTVEPEPLEELLSERSGNFEYSQAAEAEVASSAGPITDFQMAMDIDFDKGTVPGGEVSYKDDGGEWFATFGGIITSTQMDLDVTFASHGNKLADGDVNAAFLNGLDSIVGEYKLFEVENPDITTTGTFVIE